jgi:hypothetical protein
MVVHVNPAVSVADGSACQQHMHAPGMALQRKGHCTPGALTSSGLDEFSVDGEAAEQQKCFAAAAVGTTHSPQLAFAAISLLAASGVMGLAHGSAMITTIVTHKQNARQYMEVLANLSLVCWTSLLHMFSRPR